jgi:hypothetical protein
MKKEASSLFSNLFGTKSSPKTSSETKPVIITSLSQPHVLQQKMQQERLSHGETVTVNLSPVRVESHLGKIIMYFCPMEKLQVLNTITEGDGGSIPPQAIVEGLTIPANLKAGYYNLKNVQLTSNGTMQVRSTGETTWEKASSMYSRDIM